VNIKSGGSGENFKEAETPAVMEIEGKGRVIVFSFGSASSGIPLDWAASEGKPGVNLLKACPIRPSDTLENESRR